MIGVHGVFITSKCGNQHNQRRFRQVEVGDQSINHLIFIAWINKDLCIAEERLDEIVFGRLRRTFQRTHGGGTYRNHAITARFRRQHRVHHILRHFRIFGMHNVVFDGVYAHRLESTRANVQGDERHFNAFIAQFSQQRIVKMQTRGRCSDGTRFFAVHGLVQLAVGVFIRTVDIRRQRHMADGVEDIQHAAFVVKLNFKQRVMAGNHRRFNTFVVAQQQLGTRFRRFRGTNMRQNTFVIQHTLDQHFNLAAAGFTTKQTRRNDAGVVKDQQVSRVELIEQIGESTVRQRARRPVQRQQAAATALSLRIVGNQGFG